MFKIVLKADKEYTILADTPEEIADYMWTMGNYSCDCNKSLFIQRKYKEFPFYECGNKIELISMLPLQKKNRSKA